jgi:hypothetical protein
MMTSSTSPDSLPPVENDLLSALDLEPFPGADPSGVAVPAVEAPSESAPAVEAPSESAPAAEAEQATDPSGVAVPAVEAPSESVADEDDSLVSDGRASRDAYGVQVRARPGLSLELIRLGWAMTREDFCAHIGIARRTYDVLVAGGVYRPDTLSRLSMVFGVEPWELLDLTDAQRALFLRLGPPPSREAVEAAKKVPLDENDPKEPVAKKTRKAKEKEPVEVSKSDPRMVVSNDAPIVSTKKPDPRLLLVANCGSSDLAEKIADELSLGGYAWIVTPVKNRVSDQGADLYADPANETALVAVMAGRVVAAKIAAGQKGPFGQKDGPVLEQMATGEARGAMTDANWNDEAPSVSKVVASAGRIMHTLSNTSRLVAVPSK